MDYKKAFSGKEGNAKRSKDNRHSRRSHDHVLIVHNIIPSLLVSIATIAWNKSPQTGTYNNSALSASNKGSCINSLGWQNALIGPTTIHHAANGLLSNGSFAENAVRPSELQLIIFCFGTKDTQRGASSFFWRLASRLCWTHAKRGEELRRSLERHQQNEKKREVFVLGMASKSRLMGYDVWIAKSCFVGC